MGEAKVKVAAGIAVAVAVFFVMSAIMGSMLMQPKKWDCTAPGTRIVEIRTGDGRRYYEQ